MKKLLKRVIVLAMAGVMTIAPVMTASAVQYNSHVREDNMPEFEARLRAAFPSITEDHIDYFWGMWEWDLHDQYGNITYFRGVKWADFGAVEKEVIAYLCALGDTDREWLRNTSDIYVFAGFDRNFCISEGVDAAELDAIIARLTGQAAPETPVTTASVPSWKQDAKGWWIENPDGTYLTNQWYQSPESGLWYYMGADGYMLTNTTTPDGYTVNADGVWVH